MTYGGENDLDRKVIIAPADSPNSEYAIIKDGELRVDFDRLNDEAIPIVTRYDMTIRNISNENRIYTAVTPLATHDDS